MRLTALLLVALGACHPQPMPRAAKSLCPQPMLQSDHISHRPSNVQGQPALGPVPEHHEIDIAVHVGLRNEDELDALLNEIADPNSVHFGKYISHDVFAAKFLPRRNDLMIVHNALEREGLKVEPMYRGAVIRARATIGQLNSMFKTTIHHYKDRVTGQVVRAPMGPLKLPRGLNIVAVHGISTPAHRHSHARLHTARSRPHVATGFTANLVRSAYSIPPSATGKGQVIGMLELDGYDVADVNAYARAMGIAAPKLKNINIDGYQGGVISADAQVEVTLDIELAAAMAPNAEEIRIYTADQTSSTTAFFDIINEIANPTIGDRKLVSVISCSWGAPENQMAASDAVSNGQIFKQMAAQGQTFLAASGDSGAKDDGSDIIVDDPASQPYVMAVGGTTLAMDGNRYKQERAWSDGGGGVSCRWALPNWQRYLANPNNQISSAFRTLPDVSMNANPATGYSVYVSGQWQIVGGTSCAAPLWAGVLALANERRAADGKQPLGFAPPAIYSTARAVKTGFHDITVGSNGFYYAAPGFDPATGWGTPDGGALLDGLAR